MGSISIQTLGRFAVFVDGCEQPAPPTVKAQALLAFLVMHPRAEHARETLAEMFWPDSEPERSRARLSTAVWSIRKSFEAAGDRDGLAANKKDMLSWNAPVDVDALRFERLAAADRIDDWRAALELYRGDFLEGDYSEWSLAERERLSNLYERLLERILRVEPDPSTAATIVARNPYHEQAHAVLIDDALAGRRLPLARALFARARKSLSELGDDVRVDFELRYPRLAESDVALAHNLPVAPNPMIGRRRELDELLASLSAYRLVTVTGTGGIGKTRLAVEAAVHCAEAFADGAWSVELAPASSAGAVLAAIASALSIPSGGERGVLAAIVERYRHRAFTLLIDNCEQVVDPVSEVVETLLAGIPGLVVLATSREPLGLPGECIFRLDSLERADGVRLFEARAHASIRLASIASKNLIGSIVDHLDGLPLAIELVAAQTDVMEPAAILEALENHVEIFNPQRNANRERHQTLRALFDWSHELLSEDEQIAFRRISAFAGAFSGTAAAAVCAGGELPAERVLTLLAALVRKSLVVPVRGERSGEYSYVMLETVRDYAAELARRAGETAPLAAAHAAYYAALAEACGEELVGPNRDAGVARLAAEWSNVRAAIDHLMEAADPPRARRLVAELSNYWWQSGSSIEGLHYFERAMALSVPASDLERARLLGAASLFVTSDSPRIRAIAEELLEISERLGDPLGIARAHNTLARACFSLGDPASCRRHFERVLDYARSHRDANALAAVLTSMAVLAMYYDRDYDLARRNLDESVPLLRAAGLSTNLAMALESLARLHVYGERYDDAVALASESESIFEKLGNDGAAAGPRICVALAHLVQERREEAASILRGAAPRLCRLPEALAVFEYFEIWIALACDGGAFDVAARLDAFIRRRNAEAHFGIPFDLLRTPERTRRLDAGLSARDRRRFESEGAALTLEEACSLACAVPDGTAL